MSRTQVDAVTVITPELLDAMSRLIPQLSSSVLIPTQDELRQIVGSPATTLLAARTDGILSGILTFAVFALPRACGL
jgi:hypothetical protein